MFRVFCIWISSSGGTGIDIWLHASSTMAVCVCIHACTYIEKTLRSSICHPYLMILICHWFDILLVDLGGWCIPLKTSRPVCPHPYWTWTHHELHSYVVKHCWSVHILHISHAYVWAGPNRSPSMSILHSNVYSCIHPCVRHRHVCRVLPCWIYDCTIFIDIAWNHVMYIRINVLFRNNGAT